MFPLHYISQILYADSIDKGLITLCNKFSPNAYPLASSTII